MTEQPISGSLVIRANVITMIREGKVSSEQVLYDKLREVYMCLKIVMKDMQLPLETDVKRMVKFELPKHD